MEDIIDPGDTRARLSEFADLAAPLQTPWRAAFGSGRTAQGLEGA